MSVIIPEDLAKLFQSPDIYGSIDSRIEVYTQPETINNVLPGQIIYLRIPKSELTDFRGSILEFNATCSSVGGTYCRFAQPIVQIFNRIRVLANSTLLDDELEFGRIYSWKLMSKDNTQWATTLPIMEGVGSAAYRNSLATNTNFRYQLHLGLVADILNSVIPTGWQGFNQLTIELYLNSNAAAVIETDGTAPSYVVNGIQYHYANINVTPMYKKLLNERFAAGGIQFSFRAFDYYAGSIINGALGSWQVTLPFKHRKAIAIIWGGQLTSNLLSTTTNDKYITYALQSNYQDNRLKINNVYIPSDRILNTYEQYVQTCDSLDIDPFFNSYLAANWLAGTSFLIGQTICQNPRGVVENDEIIQGLDISSGNSNCISEITFSTAVTGPISTFFFNEYYAICSMDSNGNLSVTD